MALETSGFQLSQFDRAPNIPGNIGVVDTKSIYDSVTSALKQQEVFRTLQQVQGLNDASMAYQTAQAQGLLSNLPDTLAADRAKSQLFAASAPYERGLLEPRDLSERAKLSYETALNTEMGKPENIVAITRSKTLSKDARGIYDLARVAADPNASAQERNAAGIKLKTVQDANQRFKSALDSGKVSFHTTNSDGSTYVRFNDGSTGIIGYPDTYTGNTAAYLTGPISMTPGAIVPAPATGSDPATSFDLGTGPLSSSPTVGTTSFAPATGLLSSSATGGTPAVGARSLIPLAATKGGLLETVKAEKTFESRLRMDEKEYEDIRQTRDVGLPADKRTLNSLKAKTESVDAAIDEATKIVNAYGYLVTGPGDTLRSILPIPVRSRFDSLSDTIKANLGFDQLQEMRDNSKTGGALGNVSDVEGRRLESTFGSLKTTQNPADMVRTLQTIKSERQKLMARSESEYISAVSRNQAALARVRPDLAPPASPASAIPQASAEQLSFPQRESMAPSGLTFRSPDSPENRFSISVDQPVTAPEAPAPTGEFDYAPPEVPAVSVAAPASAQTTRSGLKVVSDSSVAAEPDLESDPELAPTPESDSGMSTGAALATAGGAAAAASKYAPAVVRAVSNPQAKALRAVAQLKSGLPGLSGPARGMSRVGGAAAAAFGTGYLAGETINERGPAITDAFGFTNTKADYGGKSPKLSEILADWYMKFEADPARTLGDRWADAYRAIWAAKIDDKRRAGALADLRETRKSWASAGYKLTTPVEEFDRQQSEASQR